MGRVISGEMEFCHIYFLYSSLYKSRYVDHYVLYDFYFCHKIINQQKNKVSLTYLLKEQCQNLYNCYTGILVTWSQRSGRYEYNTVAVVLMTEILKLIISTALYCKE